MKLQFTPQELISLYRSLVLDLDQDESSANLLQKVEDSILQCLLKQENEKNHDTFASWIESENQKITMMKNDLSKIAKGELLVENKSSKTSLNKSLPKRGRPKKA